MNLNEGQIHTVYQVVDVSDVELHVERRLEALGLTEGTSITVLNKKKHGALIVKVRGTRFALGQNIARGIQIREVKS